MGCSGGLELKNLGEASKFLDRLSAVTDGGPHGRGRPGDGRREGKADLEVFRPRHIIMDVRESREEEVDVLRARDRWFAALSYAIF